MSGRCLFTGNANAGMSYFLLLVNHVCDTPTFILLLFKIRFTSAEWRRQKKYDSTRTCREKARTAGMRSTNVGVFRLYSTRKITVPRKIPPHTAQNSAPYVAQIPPHSTTKINVPRKTSPHIVQGRSLYRLKTVLQHVLGTLHDKTYNTSIICTHQ